LTDRSAAVTLYGVMRALRLALIVASRAASSSDETKPSDSGTASDTAQAPDTNKSDALDCSRVGCAQPPPCGQPCTEPCGCCPNTTCDGG